MNRMYRTPKGTELPLLNLRGKEYLEVKYRLVWFREEHPDWSIVTAIVERAPDAALVKAEIVGPTGQIMATAHKYEDKKGFPDFLEKAETGAIGRSLALCGYGTQFCAEELEEGNRLVDAPTTPTQAQPEPEAAQSGEPGDYVITFGKKYAGVKLKEIPRAELEGYIQWLDESATKKNMPLSSEARFLKVAVVRYLEATKLQAVQPKNPPEEKPLPQKPKPEQKPAPAKPAAVPDTNWDDPNPPRPAASATRPPSRSTSR